MPNHNRSQNQASPTGPVPMAEAPNLPKYGAFIYGKHPGMPMVLAKDGFDVTKPINPMERRGCTITQIVLNEPYLVAERRVGLRGLLDL